MGHKHSDETKKQMSKYRKLHNPVNDPEVRKKIAQSLKGNIPWNKGKKGCFSAESLKKLSQANLRRTPDWRIKLSVSHKGLPSGMKGKSHTEEANRKNAEAHKGKMTGAKHPNWNGGKKAAKARSHTKRRQLGYTPLNAPFNGSAGHHINKIHVIHIPNELHKSIPHRQSKPETMKRINRAAMYFLCPEFMPKCV